METNPNPIDYTRPVVEHKTVKTAMPFVRYVYLSLPYTSVLIPTLLVYWLVGFLLQGTPRLVVAFGVAIYCFLKVKKSLSAVLQREQGYEWKYPSAKHAPIYKDSDIMRKLWIYSPYRYALLSAGALQTSVASEKQLYQRDAEAIKSFETQLDTGRQGIPSLEHSGLKPLLSSGSSYPAWDKPESLIFSQPVEGYCGDATINTLLRSFVGVPLQPMPPFIRPMSLSLLKSRLESEVMQALGEKAPFKSVRSVNVDPKEVSYEQFLDLISLANLPNYRVLINFLRAASFGEGRPMWPPTRAITLMGGHWSPLASVGQLPPSSTKVRTLCDEVDMGYVGLVLDVNSSYGPFAISARRMYDSCATKDGNNFRGVLIIEV